MNASLSAVPPPLPPPLPGSRIPRNYREKIRAYTSARRKFLAHHALRRVVAIVLACAIAAIVGDIFFEPPELARRLILGALAVSALALLAWWWWRPAMALGEPETIRDLEHRVPELGQRLRTSREAESATSAAGIVGVLASGLVADTRIRMSGLDLDKLILWKSIRPSLYLCLAAMAVFLLSYSSSPAFRVGTTRLLFPAAGASFTTVSIEPRSPNFKDIENPMIGAATSGRKTSEATLFTWEEGGEWKAQKMDRAATPRHFMALLTGRKQDFDFYVTSGDGRSAQQHLHCLLTPRIEKAEAVIEFPDYIGEPPKHSAGGDVKAVEDSKVTVVFQTNPPLTQAVAHAVDGRYLPLTISGNKVILEQKLARGEVVYELSGSDAEGIDLPPSSFKLTGIEDKAPEVQLVEPKKDVEATSVWEILARLTAKDDFGLAEVGIVLVVGNDIKMIAHREIGEKNVRAVSEMGTAALEDFPLSINDNLKIYAFARDHKPRDGARSVSKLVAIDIRQFQTRWQVMQGQGGMPMSGRQLGELFNLIKLQRGVVSDVFALKENGVPSDGDLGTECDKIRKREDAIAERAMKLKKEVEATGMMKADDVMLLGTAAQQMGEASGHLEQRLPRPAYKQADRALSSLLALKKLIMKLMSQSKSAMPSEAEKEQSKATSLSDLAAEAARLAKEEHEVRDKVTADPAQPQRELEVTRHQQEVAVTDAGELFAGLVRHPGASELALQRMDEAEKLMQKAEDAIKGAAPGEAGPGLQSAEDTLLKLAAQLRALDEKNMDETLGKLAQMAAEAQARMEKEQKEREKGQGKDKDGKNPDQAKSAQGKNGQSESGQEKKGSENKGDAAKTGDTAKNGDAAKSSDTAKNGDAAKNADAAKKGDAAKNGETAKPGDAKDDAKAAAQRGKELDKAADQGATIDDALKALAGREGAEKDGERLAELREKAKTGELQHDIQGLKGEKDDAKAAGKAGNLGNRFGQLGEGLRAEQRHLQQSRIEQLTDLQTRTKQFEKEDAKKGEHGTAGKNSEKTDAKPDETAKADADKSREEARAGKSDKSDRSDKTSNSDKTTDRTHSEHTGRSRAANEYLKDMGRLSDEMLGGLLAPLGEDLENGEFKTSHLEPVADRLAKILDDLVKSTPSERRRNGVPDQYSHLVDEYFRALSEDFGSDARTAPESPRRE